MKRYRFLAAIGLGLVVLSWVPAASIAAAKESDCVKVPAESMPGAKCRDAVGAPKPALDLIEDGLAYLLDIPLAILSPITCPIISPILDDINEKQERYYVRAKKCP
jgi:hypothetical protein